jgi:DNA replication protein DnaC
MDKQLPYYDKKWKLQVNHVDLRAAQVKVGQWANGEHVCVVLYGNPGSGKTHMANVVVQHFQDPLYIRLISEPDLLSNIKETYGGNGSEARIIGNLRNMERLIIDDVGAARVKNDSLPWLHDIYWRLLDGRLERGRSLLITTNLSQNELAVRLGPRASSRLVGLLGDESNYVDMTSVPDYRRNGK